MRYADSAAIHQLATHDLFAAFLRAGDSARGEGIFAWVPERAAGRLFGGYLRPDAVAGIRVGDRVIALFVERDLKIISQKTVSPAISRQAVDLLRHHGLDVWVYAGNEWLITQPDAPHVAHEAWTVKFEPKVVKEFDGALESVAKIVGVSDDLDRVRRCEADAQAAFGVRASASRSQPYYLDITNKDANKGAVLEYLSHRLEIPAKEIATIGDQPNDVLMFKRSGFSIAMGNASDEVKAQATAVTESYDDEGFAKAMERFVLGSMD